MQIIEGVKDLLGVVFYDAFMQWTKVLVLRLQGVRHEFHEDWRFVLCFVKGTTIVLDNMLVFERFKQFQLLLEFNLEALVLDTYHLDRHLRGKQIIAAIGAWILRLSSIIQSLVHLSKGSFTKLLSSLDCQKLESASLVDLNFILFLFRAIAIGIKYARKVFSSSPQINALTSRQLITVLDLDIAAYLWMGGHTIWWLLSTALTILSYRCPVSVIFELERQCLIIFGGRIHLDFSLWLLARNILDIANFRTALTQLSLTRIHQHVVVVLWLRLFILIDDIMMRDRPVNPLYRCRRDNIIWKCHHRICFLFFCSLRFFIIILLLSFKVYRVIFLAKI